MKNENNVIIEQSKDIVKIRQEFIWHFVYIYLDNLNGMNVMCDEEFKAKLEELLGYVNDKCNSSDFGGDILDFYVVVERLLKNKE